MTTPPRILRPAIQRQPPHAGLLKIVNPVFTALLRSPAHRLLDGFRPRLVVLQITGRRTGRRYTVVVGRHVIDGMRSVFTSSPWRVNLRGGADVEMTDGGRTFAARALLVEDPDVVADAYAVAIQRVGCKAARRQLGVKINIARTPTHAELVEAVVHEHLSLVHLQPN